MIPADAYIACALVRQGLVPCSPITPTTAITFDTLELFRVARNRNPHFSVQAFVKTMSDLQGVQFKPSRSRQFTIAFDVYLQLRHGVKKLALSAIQRDVPEWRLKNACPACTYTLEDEPNLKFKMLYTMDGNDSLKRAIRQSAGGDEEGSSPIPPPTEGLLPGQVLGCDRYLTREEVDQYAKDVGNADMDSAETDEQNPCASRWKNMKDGHTAKMWGVFDETGVFLAVCRHGFSLAIADMVQSGERAKYPLAIVSRLLNALGKDLGGGYDIGCKFKTTLDRSSVGERARKLNHTSLVGSFHGHAHGRLCQLQHLATYTEGLGLEDLEGCERTFSKSNALAGSVRYSGVFHRRQAISEYFEHNDEFEIYQSLSTFLYNNYKQALEKLKDGNERLPQLMEELGITDKSVFKTWLAEERTYLMSRQTEPEEETLQMTYWQRLVKLSESKAAFDALNAWQVITPEMQLSYDADASATTRAETAKRHTQETYEKDLKIVQELESKLNIACRWEPEDEEWQLAGRMVARRKYQRALDHLEGLVVARIFELGKMNRAGTGYKLRKHIGKALQSRSAAIRTAIDHYNITARALSPPRRVLTYEEVIEYAFLADFDLLRDTREDISQRPWASPSARLALDTYFKMCRAEEEIERLDVEIHRFVTYLRDEDRYLRGCVELLWASHPALAYQVFLHRNVRARFNGEHLKKLAQLLSLPGFSGSLSPGVSTKKEAGASAGKIAVVVPALASAMVPVEVIVEDTPEELEEEEEEEEEAEEYSRALEDVLLAASGP
ncbi:hypothetical protein HYDPIDRAFT_163072 [Hydnomerulius pinastri MD-312]|uniref:CxC2-like cysteine cluster KDZ transposase-associated domain-containing protein n=1 Tax=Hydnomerulius pinastri MD-312 TaxID=994086 RepID=A0A0C9W848_9AGAM|nr:hypothetical protein HYDPIDRAFT_163072 [Hydnomerulius pinastri MD-312]